LNTNLDQFLSQYQPVSHGAARWGGGIELEVTGYFCSDGPPPDLVSSVRAIVLNENCVLVMNNSNGTHIIPGGRLEEGETHEEALKRELLEEAGAEIKIINHVGFVHLRHTTPKPNNYQFLYPDFLWAVYSASFERWRPDAKIEDDYEISSRFLHLRKVRCLQLEDYELAFLEATTSD
jgi:ADP-ribose pyrophosphatase YjhB (NUDIX family)